METLAFCPVPGYSVENEPRRKVNQFGNGYQQRIVDGLNPLLRKFSLTFKLTHQRAVIFEQFLIRHSGVNAFYFKDCANQHRLIKVVCPKWTSTVKRRFIEFNCNFEEVL